MTITIQNPFPMNYAGIAVISNDFFSSGSIKLWKDAKKETEIVLLPNGISGTKAISIAQIGQVQGNEYTFYIEGTKRSAAVKDLRIQFAYGIMVPGPQPAPQAAVAEEYLTVRQIYQGLRFLPRQDPISFYYSAYRGTPELTGLNSGQQNFPGDWSASKSFGIRFTGSVNRAGAEGSAKFVQTVIGLVNGLGSGITLNNRRSANFIIQVGKDDRDQIIQGALPILDPASGSKDTQFYVSPRYKDSGTSIQTISDVDAPFLAAKRMPLPTAITSMDVLFTAETHLMFRFKDSSLVPLASERWDVLFKASTVNGVLTVDPSARVTIRAQGGSTDTMPAILVGPYFNDQIIGVGDE